MKHLLIVAHGSRRAESNDEVRHLAALLREQAGKRFDDVDCAFLEIAEPSIPDGIECSVRRGATEVVVMPYFLSAGRHVAEDIPREVTMKQDEHPQVRIHIAPYLGAAGGIARLMLDQAEALA